MKIVDTEEEEEKTPWTRPPSGRHRGGKLNIPLPEKVRAVLAQRLFFEKELLPSLLVTRLKRLAAFQNPEFYKKQKMRFPTTRIPRVISCFEEIEGHLALPRGCLPGVKELFQEQGIHFDLDDRRQDGTPQDFEFMGSLAPEQKKAAMELLGHETGILVSPPGSGKTVVETFLVAARKRNTLILVHLKPLLEQWVAQLSLFLGIPAEEIGRIGSGKNKPNGCLDVAMLQSLRRAGVVRDLVAGYGHVIVDECHHLGAESYEKILAECHARFVTGLTATPRRRDGLDPILEMQIGPIRHVEEPKAQVKKGGFWCHLLVRDTRFSLPESIAQDPAIQEIYAALAADPERNALILRDIEKALAEKRSPIVLTERRDHLEFFAEKLKTLTPNLIVLYGGLKTRERKEMLQRLVETPVGEGRIILATGRFIGEGFDDSRLDTLFLTLPVSWKGTLVQYSGRLHRSHEGKTEVRIYDYVDSGVGILRKMFSKRLRGYRAMGYQMARGPGLFDGISNAVPGNSAP